MANKRVSAPIIAHLVEEETFISKRMGIYHHAFMSSQLQEEEENITEKKRRAVQLIN